MPRCHPHRSQERLDSSAHVWCVRLGRERDLVERACVFLAPDERVRADGFRFQDLRDDYIVAHGVLRVLLSRLGCAAPGDLRFTYGPYGKPALDGEAGSSIRFNISESKGLLACAFARDCDIGVDVEYQTPHVDWAAISQRFFSPAEQRELLSLAEPSRAIAFYDGWVRKEAFVKAIGGGLSIPLDTFSVSLAPGRPAALLDVKDTPGEAGAWRLHAFSPAPQFSGAAALRDRQKPVHVHHADARNVLLT